jgi:predicted RNase H-like HicB family nuclease
MKHEMNAPIIIEVKIHLTDGNQTAVASIEMPKGVYPTASSFQELMDRTVETLLKETPEGFRLMNKKEFWNYLLSEKTGVSGLSMATPGNPEFVSPEQ